MKLFPVLLVGSLAVNAALLAALVFVPSGPPTSAAVTASAAAEAGLRAHPVASVTARGSASVTATHPASSATARTWGFLSAEGIPSLVARLRTAGFPASLQRKIINQRFELRREELTLDGLDHPYWKSDSAFPEDPKITAELKRLENERTDTLKSLFGTNDDDDVDGANALQDREYGKISPEKISQLQAIQRNYSERLSALFEASRGSALESSTMEKLAALNAQQHGELAKLLTPAELFEYDLRNSSTAVQLRSALTGLNATEAEFRALFPLYQAFVENFPPGTDMTKPENRAAVAAAHQQMDEQIKTLLPSDRYANYLQTSNPENLQLNSLVTRLDLPLSAAAQVIKVQQEIQSRANALRVDAKLAPDDRAAQLAALSGDATARITAVIGVRGLEGYKTAGGQWLQQLQPRPVQPRAGKKAR